MDVLGSRDIRRDADNACTCLLQLLDYGVSRRRSTSTSYEDNGSGALLNNPAGDEQPQSAQTTGDQIRAIRAYRATTRLGYSQHDLADVTRLGHMTEGIHIP